MTSSSPSNMKTTITQNKPGLLSRLPLSFKILLPILLAVALGYGASTFVSSQRSGNVVHDLAMSHGQEMTQARAAELQAMFNANYQIVYTLRDS